MSTITLIGENSSESHNYKLYEVTIDDIDTIQTLVTSSPFQVDTWLYTYTYASYHQGLIVGLIAEWPPNTQPNMNNPVATLHLCVDHHCLIFQILHAPSVPDTLISFLACPDIAFVGVGIQGYVQKLFQDYNLRVANAYDLRFLAAKQFDSPELYSAELDMLGLYILGIDVSKPYYISTSRWDNPSLTEEQVQCATVDTFVSCGIARDLTSPY